MRRLDVVGQTFGQLTILSEAAPQVSAGRPLRFVNVRCTCGNEKAVALNTLRKGATSSCGCLRKQVTGDRARSHGDSDTRLYRIWKGMHTRCATPSASGYEYYGARGISVCPEWADFEPFKAWAVAHGYAENLTIDRENGDLNYTPSNCRWITHREQCNNRRPRSF